MLATHKAPMQRMNQRITNATYDTGGLLEARLKTYDGYLVTLVVA